MSSVHLPDDLLYGRFQNEKVRASILAVWLKNGTQNREVMFSPTIYYARIPDNQAQWAGLVFLKTAFFSSTSR